LTTYVWEDGKLIDKRDASPRPTKHADMGVPYIIGDLPGYASPVGTGWIEGRAARREDLKRTGCREVDPSEYKPQYHNKTFAKKWGKEYTPAPQPSEILDD
jgi:hypothetical protein